MEEVVGRVRQVDPETHPYPSYLLLKPAGKPGLASRPACQSGRQARVRQSPIGLPDRRLVTDPAFVRSHGRVVSWGCEPRRPK
jgi:hypothetical protein